MGLKNFIFFFLQEMLELVKNYHKVSDDGTSALS